MKLSQEEIQEAFKKAIEQPMRVPSLRNGVTLYTQELSKKYDKESTITLEPDLMIIKKGKKEKVRKVYVTPDDIVEQLMAYINKAGKWTITQNLFNQEGWSIESEDSDVE